MAWPAVKKAFSQEEFRAHVATLQWSRWRPSLIVLHNTAAPTWAQWHKTAEQDRAAGKVPGSSRIDSMENYFRDEKGWSGAPHLFVPEDRIWEFNPLTEPGVHSPSWNHVSIGIEMVADFDREDDGSGPGLLVRRNAVFAAAVLCSALGLEPRAQVKLHREDPKTTHACPGEDFARDESQVIAEIAALMDGGEHNPLDVAIAIGGAPLPTPPAPARGVTNAGDLNVRRGPGVNNESIGSLPKGVPLEVLDKASNGATGWLRVRTPAGHVGWVAGRFVTLDA
jgi:hypothetical protein